MRGAWSPMAVGIYCAMPFIRSWRTWASRRAPCWPVCSSNYPGSAPPSICILRRRCASSVVCCGCCPALGIRSFVRWTGRACISPSCSILGVIWLRLRPLRSLRSLRSLRPPPHCHSLLLPPLRRPPPRQPPELSRTRRPCCLTLVAMSTPCLRDPPMPRLQNRSILAVRIRCLWGSRLLVHRMRPVQPWRNCRCAKRKPTQRATSV
mmetsp:Transcript_11535/g.35282  ORF Transcript_11535/g.35282 Transcript_11535/m.35282 type:complete len:207 (-) Transcript_11535:1605-2225(-)